MSTEDRLKAALEPIPGLLEQLAKEDRVKAYEHALMLETCAGMMARVIGAALPPAEVAGVRARVARAREAAVAWVEFAGGAALPEVG